jgi:hypothetical protein
MPTHAGASILDVEAAPGPELLRASKSGWQGWGFLKV